MMATKTSILVNIEMRAKEEFAEYFPKALQKVDQKALNRMGVRMADMVDVFRAVYMEGFANAAIIQLTELPRPYCATVAAHVAKI